MTNVQIRRSSRWLGFVLGALVLGRAAPVLAAPPELPPDLKLVPPDAACFVHVRAADIWNAPWMRDLRHVFDKAGPEAYKTFVKKFAPDPSTIDRLTLVMLTPQSMSDPFAGGDPDAVSSLLIVRTSKPYDRLRVMETLGSREKVYRRNLYYFNEDMWTGLLFIDDQTFVFGSEDALVQFVDRARNRVTEGPLQSALGEAAAKHQVLIAFNHRLLRNEAAIKFFPPPMQKLMEAESSTMTFDLQKDARLHLRLEYAKGDDAQTGEKALRDTLELGRQGLGMGIQELDKILNKKKEDRDRDNGPLLELTQGFGVMLALGALREMDTLLKDAKIERQGSIVNLPITYSGLESSHMGVVSLFGMASVGFNTGRRFQTVGRELGIGDGKNPTEEHLKKLVAALDKYHQDKGAYAELARGAATVPWRGSALQGIPPRRAVGQPAQQTASQEAAQVLPGTQQLLLRPGTVQDDGHGLHRPQHRLCRQEGHAQGRRGQGDGAGRRGRQRELGLLVEARGHQLLR
jgi:hypothetical protein